MKWNICIGNPPYGMRTKKTSTDLHLQIMKTVLDFCTDKLCFIMPSKPIVEQSKGIWYDMFRNAVCTDIETVSKEMFPNTTMDNTAIFYCDRNANPDDYCKKLDVDDKIYNIIDPIGKLYVDYIGKIDSLKIFKAYALPHKDNEELSNKMIDNWCKLLNDDKYYLNVNRFNGAMGAKWISSILKEEDVHTKEEEIEFMFTHRGLKNILECPNKKYGENLKSLMMNGVVLRYGLWLTQKNQAIIQAQFKYVPNIDYTSIDSDEKLLSECGFSNDEIEKVMNYLKDFDFTKNRNEMVRSGEIKSEPESESSPKSNIKERLKVMKKVNKEFHLEQKTR